MTALDLKIGGKYKHYKGGIYEILHIAMHTETSDALVIYKKADTKVNIIVWARPITSFCGKNEFGEDRFCEVFEDDN